jgi:hypothetical protein
MQLIVADKPAEMWDVRYKVPVIRKYKHGEDPEKEYLTYQHYGVKVVAMSAADACALVTTHSPKAIVLGVHHRAGSDDSRVLIDKSLISAAMLTAEEATSIERARRLMIEERDKCSSDVERRIWGEHIDIVQFVLERIG